MSDFIERDGPRSAKDAMNRRKRKLIRLDLQLKIVFITLFVASLVLLINFQLTLAGLWSLSNQFLESRSVDLLLESIRDSTIQKFLISVSIAVPLAASVGILYSFKFCGPLYKFKKYFTELQSGRWDERCMLRKGDDLQDICEAINAGIDGFRDRLRRNHSLLQEVKAFLGEVAITADGRAQARLRQIQEEIETEARLYRERFEPEGRAAGASGAAEARGAEVEERELEAQQ
jgi:hypothetical protein